MDIIFFILFTLVCCHEGNKTMTGRFSPYPSSFQSIGTLNDTYFDSNNDIKFPVIDSDIWINNIYFDSNNDIY